MSAVVLGAAIGISVAATAYAVFCIWLWTKGRVR